MLVNIPLHLDLLTCIDVSLHCKDFNHKHDIDEMYGQIVDCLQEGSKDFLCQNKSKKHSTIPDWNEYVTEAHSEAREVFLL